MAHSNARRFLSPAQLDAAIAFGGKRSALSEALGEAREQFHSAIQGGRTSARLTQQAASVAKPEVDAIYGGAQSALQAGQQRAEGALGALPHDPVLDAYRAAQAGSGQTQLANILAAGASRKAHLTNLGVAAQAGAQFDESAARSQLQKAVAGILAKNQNVRGEEGLYAASEAQKLAREAEKAEAEEARSIRTAETSRKNSEEGNAQQEHGSERTAATSRQNAREAARSKGSNGGLPPGYQTADKQDQAAEKINQIKSTAYSRYLKAHPHLERGQLAAHLEKGIEVKGLKVPAFNKGPLLNAALDEIEYGFVTHGTVKELHRRGYSVKALALKTVSQRKEAEALSGRFVKAFSPLTGK